MELQAEYKRKTNVTTVIRDIVICTNCKGEGKIKIKTEDPSYNGPWIEDCWCCKGSGRLICKITTELSPFIVSIL
jgi:DnaJ-class molecular chaperone